MYAEHDNCCRELNKSIYRVLKLCEQHCQQVSKCSADLQPLRKWRFTVNKRYYRKGRGDTRERHHHSFSEQKVWCAVVSGLLMVMKETGNVTSGTQSCFGQASFPHPLSTEFFGPCCNLWPEIFQALGVALDSQLQCICSVECQL